MLHYIYDNTFEGFLTAIFDAFYSKEKPYKILTKEEYVPDLLSEEIYIHTNIDKYKKVKQTINSKVDPKAYKKIYYLYLSNHPNKGILCCRYISLALKHGALIHNHLHLEDVREVDLINKQVSLEAHRFTGFVRFSYINDKSTNEDKFLYSKIEPDNNILELISPHFKRRFPNEFWIIADSKRNIASIYNKISWEIIDIDAAVIRDLDNVDTEYKDLWKEYFKFTTIKERLNPKLQKRSMPKRYWDNLTETKE